jgi:hypothetical protein
VSPAIGEFAGEAQLPLFDQRLFKVAFVHVGLPHREEAIARDRNKYDFLNTICITPVEKTLIEFTKLGKKKK